MSLPEKGDMSFFGAKIAYRGKDASGDVYVLDYADGHRVLSFETLYEQSRMDRRNPYFPVHEYIQAMLLVHAFVKPRAALLLGLGAGVLLRALHRLDSAMQLEAVEIRELVMAVADEYFGLPISDNVKITVADAEKRLHERETASADIIYADMYEAYDMHPLQKQVYFVEECHRVLSPSGWLVLNFHQLPNANSSQVIVLQDLFQELLLCSVADGNVIVFAGKQPLEKPLDAYRAALQPLQDKLAIDISRLYPKVKPWREKSSRLRKSGRKRGLQFITGNDNS